MTRMSREFSLVLLGAGLLTAGYFMPGPEKDFEKKADEQAEKRVGGRPRTTGGTFIFIGHFGGGGATAPAAAARPRWPASPRAGSAPSAAASAAAAAAEPNQAANDRRRVVW